jgi:hypothetical protein
LCGMRTTRSTLTGVAHWAPPHKRRCALRTALRGGIEEIAEA